MIPKVLDNKSKALIAIAFAGWLTFLACSINVKDHDANGNSKVDINTPMGQIHVNEDADVRDTDLPVYPGAKLKPKNQDSDEKSANVNISSMGFGLKVVALEYESNDAPEKIRAFYQDKMKKFGSVLECHTSKHGGDVESHYSGHDSNLSKPVSCGGESGHVVELKAGTEGNQHIVSIEPEGKGSDFALVYVQIHGKQAI